jgi:hypothetical protein
MVKYWKTREGKKIPIRDMTDAHLKNAVQMLERRFAEWIPPPPPNFNGEMAQYYAEQEWDRLCRADIGDIFPIIRDLWEEQEQRQKSNSIAR